MPRTSANDSKSIVLEYRLRDLPSASHKAGLAGLLLLIDALKQSGREGLPELLTADKESVKISFTRDGLQIILDEMYSAASVETAVKTKWAGAEPVRVEDATITNPKSGKTTTEKRYVYSVVTPSGNFYNAMGLNNAPAWTKFWGDTLWNTTRSIPKTREVFQDRAAGQPARRSGAAGIWPGLCKFAADMQKGKVRTVSIPGSLMLGSQGSNPELVDFLDRADNSLLLHFWPIVMQPYQQQVIDKDGKESFHDSYIITIPEISHLPNFMDDFINVMRDKSGRVIGYRPAESVIATPEEGALDYLLAIAQNRTSRTYELSADSVEVFHVKRKGNTLAMLGGYRICPTATILEEFGNIKRTYRSTRFKSLVIRNLVARKKWHADYARLSAAIPASQLVYTHDSPIACVKFCSDVRKKFKILSVDTRKGVTVTDTTVNGGRDFVLLVHDLIRSYVNRKTEARCDKSYEQFKAGGYMDAKYIEANNKICMDAFYAIRGRKDQAEFTSYFTGTICSVPQWLPPEDFAKLSLALLDSERWEEIKSIALLALSATCQLPKSSTLNTNDGGSHE